jgi:hypothetical protein
MLASISLSVRGLPCGPRVRREKALNFSDFANNPLQSPVMRGIEFEVVWFDHDVIEYQVVCSNGCFAGTTKMYLNHDDLQNAANTLSGFPSSTTDRREVELGAFDSSGAGGGIHISFYCVDSAGHAVAFVRLRDDGRKGFGEAQSLVLYVPVEAGAIDSFVKAAQSIRDTKGAKAYLHMADHTLGWVRKALA